MNKRNDDPRDLDELELSGSDLDLVLGGMRKVIGAGGGSSKVCDVGGGCWGDTDF